MEKPMITVIGSLNMDLVVETNVFPNEGETVLGENFQTKPGGKGANQAVAAARLGANVHMIGKVGDDENGHALLNVLKNEGISTEMVEKVAHVNTGVANITICNRNNRIIVVPGANNDVTPEYVKQFADKIVESDFVVVQFETPIETILYVIDLCKKHNTPIIVNPAPAQEIPVSYWEKVTYITPNESEAAFLFDEEMKAKLDEKLIITMGDEGVSYVDNNVRKIVPAHSVQVVDTTGAGDTFNGAFAVALAEKMDIHTAIKFANAASALSIQKLGAQSGMPLREEVETFLNEKEKELQQ